MSERQEYLDRIKAGAERRKARLTSAAEAYARAEITAERKRSEWGQAEAVLEARRASFLALVHLVMAEEIEGGGPDTAAEPQP